VTVAGQLATAIDRLRAEQQLRKLNIDLEQRVNERTALLEMANRELEAFSYSVSHDLRAPLRRINGFARILVEDFSEEITPEMAKYIEKISNSSAKMAQLIDGLLDFSRLGRKSLSRTTMELNGLVRTLIETLSAEASDCEIDWVTADLPPVYADPVLMQQVFANLLGNAVKYTSKCQAARIEIGKLAQDGKTVFFVRDNGVGFDMTYAEHLFGVFQRFHNDDEFEGAGIGLALVKRIIERHGGQIWAEAEPDKGATFYFSLG
jgi:hypothetical protein